MKLVLTPSERFNVLQLMSSMPMDLKTARMASEAWDRLILDWDWDDVTNPKSDSNIQRGKHADAEVDLTAGIATWLQKMIARHMTDPKDLRWRGLAAMTMQSLHDRLIEISRGDAQ